MWKEHHESIISDFLTVKDKRLLVLNFDENNELQARFEIPSVPASQFTYFVKSYYTEEITKKETFFKHVQYGNFNGKHLLSLLRLTSGLYAPMFFGNKTWPDSTCC
jgi:hypothetical protein